MRRSNFCFVSLFNHLNKLINEMEKEVKQELQLPTFILLVTLNHTEERVLVDYVYSYQNMRQVWQVGKKVESFNMNIEYQEMKQEIIKQILRGPQ